MRKVLDICDFIKDFQTTSSTIYNVVEHFIKRRKELKYSQKKLAELSGISYGSIKRFEQKGEISFKSLVRLAEVMNYLNDFNMLFKQSHCLNIKDIIV